jgi:hypothetical protein
LREAFGRAWRFAATTFAGGPEAEGGPRGATEDGTTGPATGCVVGSPKGSTHCSASDGSGNPDPAMGCTPCGSTMSLTDSPAAGGPGTIGSATDTTVSESSPTWCTAECSIGVVAPSG